jgi:hypothetical protein
VLIAPTTISKKMWARNLNNPTNNFRMLIK